MCNKYFLLDMLPDLYKQYPNLDVTVAVKPASNLQFTTTSGKGFSVAYSTSMLFSVINADNKTTTPAFILRGDFSVLVSTLGIVPVSSAHFNVTGNIAEVNTTLLLQESFIGNMSVTNLNNMIRILVKSGVVNYYNKLLKAGIPVALPPDFGLVISNPAIVFNNGYTSIMSDVDYQFDNSNKQAAEATTVNKNEQVLRIMNQIKALRNQIDALQEQVQQLLTM